MCGFAQQRACKFTCQSEVCTPKGGSTRNACGCFLKKQPNPPLSANKKAHLAMCCFVGGEGWIRTTEVTDNRFTVCSLWPLGNLSVWSWWSESNQQPTDYKSVALPVELHQHIELLVPRGGLEPPTQGFSVPCSTTWATEAYGISIPFLKFMAVTVVTATNLMATRRGLEPLTSSVTGWRTNQLYYRAK